MLQQTQAGSEDRTPLRLLGQGTEVPERDDLTLVEGVSIAQIRPNLGHEFVHGAHLLPVGPDLWCAFAQNSGPENTATESAMLRTSADGGSTWSDDSPIATPEPSYGVSHGVFMRTATGDVHFLTGVVNDGMKGIGTRRYVWSPQTEAWTGPEWVADGFWPLQEPIRLDSGRLLMAGVWKSDGLAYLPYAAAPPAVLVSRDGTGAEWRMVVPLVESDGSYWGESSLLSCGDRLLLLARSSPETGVLLAAQSVDGGQSWSATAPTDLPFTSSKPHAGRLSTGEPYLIGTSFTGVTSQRSVLTISLGRPGSTEFTITRAIRFAEQSGLPDSSPGGALSYPHAIEHDGNLYITYSNDGGRRYNCNGIELATIPVTDMVELVQAG